MRRKKTHMIGRASEFFRGGKTHWCSSSQTCSNTFLKASLRWEETTRGQGQPELQCHTGLLFPWGSTVSQWSFAFLKHIQISLASETPFLCLSPPVITASSVLLQGEPGCWNQKCKEFSEHWVCKPKLRIKHSLVEIGLALEFRIEKWKKGDTKVTWRFRLQDCQFLCCDIIV